MAEHHYRQALEQMEGSGDQASIATAKNWLGSAYLGPGHWKQAEPLISQAVQAYEELNLLTEYMEGFYLLRAVCGYAQSGYCLAVQGKNLEARRRFEAAAAPELLNASNLPTKTLCMSWQGLFVALIGENHVDAVSRADELVQIAERSDSPFQILGAYVSKTNVLMGIEDYAAVRNYGGKALEAIEGKNIRSGHVDNLHYNLARASLELGDLEAAERHYPKFDRRSAVSPVLTDTYPVAHPRFSTLHFQPSCRFTLRSGVPAAGANVLGAGVVEYLQWARSLQRFP
jgi:tetratricopeptide (TPR) repeat protein